MEGFRVAQIARMGGAGASGQELGVRGRRPGRRPDRLVSRRLIFDLFLNGAEVVALCDDVFAPALHEIGDQWDCGDAEVYQERRSCEIVGQLIYELRSALPPVDASAPLAMGGTPSGDEYRLPTQMVELVLTELGWRATSLGSSLPFETIEAAILEHRPPIFWLSLSHIEDEPALLEAYADMRKQIPATTQFLLGGQALSPELVDAMQPATFCENFRELQQHAAKAMAG